MGEECGKLSDKGHLQNKKQRTDLNPGVWPGKGLLDQGPKLSLDWFIELAGFYSPLTLSFTIIKHIYNFLAFAASPSTRR